MAKDERVYFPFYFTFRETAKTMPPRLRAVFYESIIEYGATGIEPTLPKSIAGYWPIIKPMLDTSQQRYSAAKKGGKASKESRFGSNKARLGRVGLVQRVRPLACSQIRRKARKSAFSSSFTIASM